MASEFSATARPPQQTAQDYQAFSEILAASERGRAFLDEHARRSRSADSERLMTGLARIEALVRANATAAEPLRAELVNLLAIMRRARPEIAAGTLPMRAAKLAKLFELMERRLTALAAPVSPLPANEPGRTRLAVVPPPKEPQLPIPSPAGSQPPRAVAAERTTRPGGESRQNMPDVNLFDDQRPQPVQVDSAPAGQPENAVKLAIAQMMKTRAGMPASQTATPAVLDKPAQPSAAQRQPPAADPLAPIMLLSEEERIALFT